MTKNDAQRRADQLRQSSRDPLVRFEVEPGRGGSRKYVVRSYRNDQPTGTTYHI